MWCAASMAVQAVESLSASHAIFFAEREEMLLLPLVCHITLFANYCFRPFFTLPLEDIRASCAILTICARMCRTGGRSSVQLLHACSRACAVRLRCTPQARQQPATARTHSSCARWETAATHVYIWHAQPSHAHGRRAHVRPHSECIYMIMNACRAWQCMLGHDHGQ